MTIPIKIINKKDFEEKYGKPNQEAVWDSIAKPWKTYVVKRIPIVEEFLKGKKGKVVDLGCGTGRNMIPGDLEYFGVDFSEEQLKYAREYAEKNKVKAKLFKSKLDKLPLDFKNNMFDYGLFIGSLHCLETEQERKNALKEFYRVLKKNANALISVWNSEDVRFKGKGKDIYMSWIEQGRPFYRYYYLYDKDELLNLLNSVGFKVLQVYKPREHDRFSKKNWIIRLKKL